MVSAPFETLLEGNAKVSAVKLEAIGPVEKDRELDVWHLEHVTYRFCFFVFLLRRPAASSWWCSPLPNEDGLKRQDRSPEGLDQKVAPIVLSRFFVSLRRSLNNLQKNVGR